MRMKTALWAIIFATVMSFGCAVKSNSADRFARAVSLIQKSQPLDGYKFSSAEFITTINELIAIGDKGMLVESLKSAVLQSRGKSVTLAERDSDGKVLLICMTLFQPVKGAMKHAKFGTTAYGVKSEKWPLFPMDLFDASPFLLINGYELGGVPEDICQFVDWCDQHCELRTSSLGGSDLRQSAVKFIQSDQFLNNSPPGIEGEEIKRMILGQAR